MARIVDKADQLGMVVILGLFYFGQDQRLRDEAAVVYADAHSRAPDFYRFNRSLESLKKVLGEKSTLILRADRAPFDLLSRKGGK